MGRPKKTVAAPAAKSTNQKPGRGRPKAAAPVVVAKPVAAAPAKGRGRPKAAAPAVVAKPVAAAPKKGRGRPKKA
ncbi:MAG: hypothetical protein ACK5C0_15475 [Candidatus Kapaibacterium sp.]